MSYMLGIDGGTESLRAHVFDLNGRSQGSAACAYSTEFPQPSWAEQQPQDWWQALATAVQGALQAAKINAQRIQALCLDTTCCSVVALDAYGQPLRPALIWMDVRAGDEAARVVATADPALRVNGGGRGPVSAEWMVPKALWIKQHEPDLFARAVRICEYQDYLNWRLTGRWVGSLNNMSVRWHYQIEHSGIPHSLLAALELDELAQKWPQDIVRPGEVIGGLTVEAAAHLGLPADVPVVQGGADAFIGMIGLGVTQPGQMALITGSSHLQLGVAERAAHKAGVWGAYADAVYAQRYIVEGGQTSTGSIINWFKKQFCSQLSYDELNAAAARLPPGAEGLLVLDHFQGNRTPYTDPLSRGALTGLTLKHGPEHVFRAIIESICFGTRLIVESFGADVFTPKLMAVAGGATQSPLWLQIHADVMGTALTLTEVPDAPALGCAILAAYASGHYASIDEAVSAMVRVRSVVEPDLAQHECYQAVYQRYLALYPALKDIVAPTA